MIIAYLTKRCLFKHAYLHICIEMEGVFMPGSAQPPHIARTQRTSAQAQHTASPHQVMTNESTLYITATIDPETVDGLGGLSRVVAPYQEPLQAGSSLSPQIPSESDVHAVFER